MGRRSNGGVINQRSHGDVHIGALTHDRVEQRAAGPAMRVMGVDRPSWGTNSNNTSKEISEILT